MSTHQWCNLDGHLAKTVGKETHSFEEINARQSYPNPFNPCSFECNTYSLLTLKMDTVMMVSKLICNDLNIYLGRGY